MLCWVKVPFAQALASLFEILLRQPPMASHQSIPPSGHQTHPQN